MNIPNFVHQPISDKDGNVTDAWGYFFDLLVQELQRDVGGRGFAPTKFTNTQLAEIAENEDLMARMKGYIIYNTTTGKFMGNEDGISFKTFTLT